MSRVLPDDEPLASCGLGCRRSPSLDVDDFGRDGLTRQPLVVAVQVGKKESIFSCALSGERMALLSWNAHMTTTAEGSDEPCQL